MSFYEVILVFFATMVKFMAGPVGGYSFGFNYFTTILITVLGMMASVFLFNYFGEWLTKRVLRKIFYKQRQKLFTKKSRRFVRIWRKYGISGIAFLTPVVFTPIGGTLILTSLGSPRKEVFFYMILSAIFWAVLITSLMFFFGNAILEYFPSLQT
ncbi:MAG: hypothetical protein OEY34_09975 [Cyclobacteriaceae bacterium]|nr:hypothetical protein [Cyclobacteriaceae bacterium]